MTDKILIVDDEPDALQGYQRLLHSHFKVATAVGGSAGLLHLKQFGPFAVVVSDKRMPQMDGVQFLQQVKTIAPDTVRVILTGQCDMQTAIEAINEGSVFRFLSKPCSKDTLVKALHDSLRQYQLVRAEKELLGDTLHGSIAVLCEVLNLSNPAAFGRSARIRRYVRHLAVRLSLEDPWQVEAAAMLSQLGCFALDPETIEKVYAGQELSKLEKEQYLEHPLVAYELLKTIPRMEPVAWMIRQQNQTLPPERDRSDREKTGKRLGAQILRAAMLFNKLRGQGRSQMDATSILIQAGVDEKIVEAILEVDSRPEEADAALFPADTPPDPRTVAPDEAVFSAGANEVASGPVSVLPISELRLGMIVERELLSSTGTRVVVPGQEISSCLLIRLKNFLARGAITDGVTVSLPNRSGEQGRIR